MTGLAHVVFTALPGVLALANRWTHAL